MLYKVIFFIASVFFILSSCKKDDGFENTNFEQVKISTSSAVSVTSISATIGGAVSASQYRLLNRGVCWNVSTNPKRTDFSKYEKGALGSFSLPIISLSPGKTYYYKAFAESNGEIIYGEERSFTTPATLATISTKSITNLVSSTATCGGSISSDGGSFIVARGVCWNTEKSPTISLLTKTVDGTGSGDYSSKIAGLQPGNVYYVRAYATNGIGTVYGNEVQFSISAVLPVVTTSNWVQNISSTSAIVGGSVVSNGGVPIVEKGICWSTGNNPTYQSNRTIEGTALGDFSSSISNLYPNTQYFFRAYAKNSIGVAYGALYSFTTKASLPVVSTNTFVELSSSSAMCGGNVSETGGLAVTARGVCWGLSSTVLFYPVNSYTNDGSGSGSFSSSISNLTPATLYYYRAYAVNSLGVSYGAVVSFSTLSTLASVTTSSVSSVGSSSATCGGNVVSDGGSLISARGVCWNTSGNPTILSSKISEGTGKGAFSLNISGLQPGTTYYLRAYVTNGQGTSYGEQVSFKTLATLPVLSTSSISSVGSTSAVSGGVISTDGGASIISKGVCWNTYGNPTINSSKTNDGGGSGSFTSSITGLSGNTTYYVRSYATNSQGTDYGSQISFTTLSPTVIINTSSVTSISTTSAVCGGSITSDGGYYISSRGVCWSSSTTTPTISNSSYASSGSGTGVFTVNLNSLSSNTTYYARAYATNYLGTKYGDVVSFSTSKSHYIGEYYGGGIVFYVDATGQHGLISATSDQSTSAQWGCSGSSISGADGTLFGNGNQNTIDIVNGCSSLSSAAYICYNLYLNGYSDWYLPSVAELSLMRSNLYLNGYGGFSGSYLYYWSSTEYNSNNAYSVLFSTGSQSYYIKGSTLRVRAIRSF